MAGQRLTDKTALDQQTGSGDLYMIVDVNDTTGSAEGTTKKIDSKFVIQTDKISVSNAEVIDLHNNEKILVGALSGYMITPISVTCLCTYAASTESSNKNLYIGYDDSSDVKYWDNSSRFMGGLSTDTTFVFGGRSAGGGTKEGSTINSPLVIWSSGAFNGGWSMDVYVTYCYTKII
tara:strand:+ start:3626 stop:4156 length:531 start_codon:yes stop_codon:yes gene_type:complete